MPAKDKIYSLDLLYNGAQAQFVFKTMEEINIAYGGWCTFTSSGYL